ncbi:hypothetical protein GN958_ATG18421 [Phytophthora infestans]|uniref:Uncharacterized protein n=1 Tax=Phytophthora infestans TaxID=4787 RepID=A0A8S9U068_PHYIN|nr:hypothetical protein GN958_ATG18421 [Phytophthora infestans]
MKRSTVTQDFESLHSEDRARPSIMTLDPLTSMTRSEELRNQDVRLECPPKLDDGEWDGFIYSRLQ